MRWEYTVVIVSGGNHPEDVMNEYGKAGWELVHYDLDNGRCELVFKRPVQP